MPTHKAYNERLSYKQMIAELIDELEQVFSDSLTIKHQDESGNELLGFYLDKKDKKYILTICSSIHKMMDDQIRTCSLSVKSKSKENRQIIISTFVEKGSETVTKTIFIGKADKNSKKIYLVDVEPRFSNLSLSKLNTKLFTPFGRTGKLDESDNVKASFKMVNMDFYIVDETSESIQINCTYSVDRRYNQTIRDHKCSFSLIAECAINYRGNWYVKGELKKSQKRTTFDKLSISNSANWMRIVRIGNDVSTYSTNRIIIFYQ